MQTGALSTGQYFWGTAGWVDVTYVTVADGPFTVATFSDPPGSSGKLTTVTLGSYDGSSITSAVVISADDLESGSGFKRLILWGTYTSTHVGPGLWYRIKGTCGVGEVARSGTWASAAACTGGLTTFAIESWADICEEQQGWYLQPDINTQAWFPITEVNEQAHTVTIAGEHASLGQQGKRFP